MIELNLLKALSIKNNYDKYLKLLNTKVLSIQSIEILKDYQRYFEVHKKDIDFNEFREQFFLVYHPNLDDKRVIQYKDIISQLHNISMEGLSSNQLIMAFEQQELYEEIKDKLERNEEVDKIVAQLARFKDKHTSLASIQPQDEEMDLNKALLYTDRSNGLKWRLESLNELFNGGLIKGDFGIIAGYVDVGKTAFLCSEVSYMAEQLKNNQWIAWLNTEGNWQQILPRIYQAALDCTYKDLTKWSEDAILKYIKLMNGDKNRIKVLNFQRKSIKDVEDLIKTNPPSLIIFDLLDHINGFDRYMGKEGNATERYGALYQWARTIATEVCPVLGISQLNGDGNNEPYPSITNLRGSRVDKQAAATFQLIIGGMEGNSIERYLSMPKNKISTNKGWRTQVTFDPLKNRFTD